MFVWVSNGNRSGFGGCGLSLLLIPLFLCSGSFGDASPLLMMVVLGLFALFVLPRLFAFNTPAYAGADYDKQKNDDYPGKFKNDEYDSADKPKREEYVIGADGELLEVIDEDDARYNRSPRDDDY